MHRKISEPSIIRLCLIYRTLEEMEKEGVKLTYSSKIGDRIGAGAHSVRKDISILGDMGSNVSGYDVIQLKDRLFANLGLNSKRNTCIVGLGQLGSAILRYEQLAGSMFKIVAGFDNDINKIEMIESSIEVFPTYRIEEIAQSRKIELAILAVPKNVAQKTADRLIGCGIKGILNFAPTIIKADRPGVFIRNMDLVTEMRILSSLLSLQNGADADGIS
jgi:redox-sensing transcriptional repressor